jgi:hypothetical protein
MRRRKGKEKLSLELIHCFIEKYVNIFEPVRRRGIEAYTFGKQSQI